LANLCQREHRMLAKRWDNVCLTTITLLFFRLWPIYDVIRKQHYWQLKT